MWGLLVKLIVCPLVIILANVIFANVNYTVLYQPIIVGLILALFAHMMEVMFLKRGTLWISTIFDFIAATLIVYLVSLLQEAKVTFLGAILTAIILMVTEIIQHLWLIRSGRTKKFPT